MKRLLSLLCLLCGVLCSYAQAWDEPVVPGKAITSLSSSEIVYFYNVETDAFFVNGMNWNTEACATRLTNGDKATSGPQQCYAHVSSGKVSIQLKNFANVFISCLAEEANNIYVDQTKNQYFTYTETKQGSHVYTLKNTAFNRDLDVSWKHGGHLTLVDGGGFTKWAFIPESEITNGAYKLYKAKKQLYNVYKAVCDAGKESQYSTALATAKTAYTATNATESSIINAARTLFNEVHADIAGPLNVSFLFDTPDMAGAASTKDWTTTNHNIAWGEFEIFHTKLTLSQTKTVPQGLYDVVFHALYRQDGTDAIPTLDVETDNVVSAEIPHVGSIDYKVTNTGGNNWKTGDQYIQPDGMQSCAQALTHHDAAAVAKNVVLMSDGEMKITAQINSESQWFNWQGFEVIYKGVGNASLKEELSQTISAAETLYGDGSGKGASDLKVVLDNAKAIYADAGSTMLQLTETNDQLIAAMDVYRKASASINQPMDWTSRISNASFEKGFDNWTQTGFALQGNTAFALKNGNSYIEKWVGKGNHVGDASIMQTISNLDMGVYMVKVAAQNIQEGSSAQQSNAWVFFNDYKKTINNASEYTFVFTNIEKDATIGFKAVGATGNWLACDNFRLYYAGGEASDYNTALQAYIDDAKSYINQKMQAPVLNTLNSAIAAAEKELQNNDIANYQTVSTPLRLAKEEAIVSIAAFASLQKAIDTAVEKYGDGSLKGADAFLAAINHAKEVNSNLNATIAEMEAEEKKLEDAAFTYLLNNASGSTPRVTTDPRFVRGSDLILGRMTYSGVTESNILEAGFCWSTQPNPTVVDNRSSAYINHNGRIYLLEGLKPATVYYIRAYAMTKTYAVGYGETMKVITIPRGECGYWYNWGADAEANERINNALADAINYYNRFTSIKGFHVSCSFGSGTPTADCGYGGGMRVGPNASYQRTGTILHEMAHGVGVGTHYMWYGYTPLRENGWNGLWMGERANKVLQFFDNNYTSMMTGDATHMWPFGINGAHEDYGNWVDYMANSMIIQGMGEDGLPPTGGFATPAYTLRSDEGVKYYIKNENENCGLATGYLTESTTGSLKWVEKSGAEVLGDDAYAWYVDFVPSTCYYRIRNAKSGKYFTYSSNSIKTASKTTPSSTENFQLMGGRIRATINETAEVQGFWIIVPQSNMTPPCLQASTNGSTSTASLNLENDATPQRWIFLSEDDMSNIESTSKEAYLEKTGNLLDEIRAMLDVPHTQKATDADATLLETLTDLETKMLSAASTAEFNTIMDNAKTAAKTFIGSASPTSVDQPFDITFFLENPSMDDNSGWNNVPTVNHSCGEFFESTFSLVQTISKAPAGTYKLTAQAFQRPGIYTAAYDDYINGTDNVNAELYIRNDKTTIKHIASEAETSKLQSEDIAVGTPTVYIPNTMLSAATHFAEGKYYNEVVSTLTNTGALRLGLRCNEISVGYWAAFDNFNLYFYGDFDKNTVTDIQTPVEVGPQVTDVYNLQGVKVGTSLEGLPKGIYIVNKRKVIVR